MYRARRYLWKYNMMNKNYTLAPQIVQVLIPQIDQVAGGPLFPNSKEEGKLAMFGCFSLSPSRKSHIIFGTLCIFILFWFVYVRGEFSGTTDVKKKISRLIVYCSMYSIEIGIG